MEKCPYFEYFTDDQQAACKLPKTIDEDIYGPFDALPGCNPVTTDNESALAASKASCPVTPIGAPDLLFTDATGLGWAYQGCLVDDSTERTLYSGASAYQNIYSGDQGSMTVENCLTTCKSKGYTYAGLEFGKQCFCDNEIGYGRTPQSFASCSVPCTGNSSEVCGGSDYLSLYKVCNGSSSCTNMVYAAIGDLKGGSTTTNENFIFSGIEAAISTAVAELTSRPSNLLSYAGITPVSSDYSGTAVASAAIGTVSAAASSLLSSIAAEDSAIIGGTAAPAATTSAAQSSHSSAASSPTSASASSVTSKSISVAKKARSKSAIASSSASSSATSSAPQTVKSPHSTTRSPSSSSVDTGLHYVTVTDFVTVTETETVSPSASAGKRSAKMHNKHAHHHAHKRHDF